jgi:hypothetical protein
VLFGSGETSPAGRKVFDELLRDLPPEPRLALLETPAGFELNSEQVIGRVAEFLSFRLQNFRPQVEVIPARRRGTPFSPDEPAVVAPLLEADLIFMGPGSPSYAVRQLEDSLAWKYLLARHRLGATLVFASAAVVAISLYAIPVYEIYKVGEDPYWKEGLDFFGYYGLPLVFVPHWNNNDGGEELDTSRCFMGQSRFSQLMGLLPPGLTVLGIDERTALIMDIQEQVCHVVGEGGVTIIHTGHRAHAVGPDLQGSGLAEVAERRRGHVHIYQSGGSFHMAECCPMDTPARGRILWPEVWQQALESQDRLKAQQRSSESPAPPPEVLELVHLRQAARQRKDWAAADELRKQITLLGWKVLDTPEGYKVVKL